jgi:hypothetical protein
MKVSILLGALVLSAAGADRGAAGGEKVLRPLPASTPPVVRALRSWDREVRHSAILSLVSCKKCKHAQAVISALLTLLDHGNDDPDDIGLALACIDRETVHHLWQRLHTATTQTRQGRALVALVRVLIFNFDDGERWRALAGRPHTLCCLLRLLHSPDISVRCAALKLANHLNPRSFRPLVAHLVRYDPQPEVRDTALHCLMDAREDAAALAPWLERLILASDFHQKFKFPPGCKRAPGATADLVALVLVRLSPASQRVFDRLLAHQDERTRFLALFGLRALGAQALSSAPFLLVPALTCPDAEMRRCYHDVLSHILTEAHADGAPRLHALARRTAHSLGAFLRDSAKRQARRAP